MKYKLDDVRIGRGETSLGPSLGGYYIDLIGSLPLIESGYHGPFDQTGVPMTRCGAAGTICMVTTVSQYALALHDKMRVETTKAELERKFGIQLDAIIRNMESEGEWAGFFFNRYDNEKYTELRDRWVSALTQGNAISALLRGYQFYKDERLMRAAEQAFEALHQPLDRGGVLFLDPCGHVWFEEYPTDPPLHVLNGHIFALWGVLDYARATGSKKAWQSWEAGIDTLRAHVANFDRGFWSLYDLRDRELASPYYQANIHAPQLEALYRLTGEPIFRTYAERWLKFSGSLGCRIAWWLALRVDARIRKYHRRITSQ